MSDTNPEAQLLANQLLADFGKTVGIEEMAFDEDGRCDLAFDELPLAISFDPATGCLCLQVALMEIPSAPAKEFFSWVLADNFSSYANGLGCLALDREAEMIVWLDRGQVKGMTYPAFEDWLSTSVDRAEFWVRHLAERSNSPELAETSESESWAGSDVVFRV